MEKEAVIKVGDILYDSSLKEYEILKVGRKWLYTTSHSRELRVDIQTLRTEADYRGSYYTLYADREKVVTMRKRNSLVEKVKKFFGTNWHEKNVEKLSMEDLERILSIVSKYN